LVGTDAPTGIETVVTEPLAGGEFEMAAVLLPAAVLLADVAD
jgi:hypothetical protein